MTQNNRHVTNGSPRDHPHAHAVVWLRVRRWAHWRPQLVAAEQSVIPATATATTSLWLLRRDTATTSRGHNKCRENFRRKCVITWRYSLERRRSIIVSPTCFRRVNSAALRRCCGSCGGRYWWEWKICGGSQFACYRSVRGPHFGAEPGPSLASSSVHQDDVRIGNG